MYDNRPTVPTRTRPSTPYATNYNVPSTANAGNSTPYATNYTGPSTANAGNSTPYATNYNVPSTANAGNSTPYVPNYTVPSTANAGNVVLSVLVTSSPLPPIPTNIPDQWGSHS
jgi:hypothetical protein